MTGPRVETPAERYDRLYGSGPAKQESAAERYDRLYGGDALPAREEIKAVPKRSIRGALQSAAFNLLDPLNIGPLTSGAIQAVQAPFRGEPIGEAFTRGNQAYRAVRQRAHTANPEVAGISGAARDAELVGIGPLIGLARGAAPPIANALVSRAGARSSAMSTAARTGGPVGGAVAAGHIDPEQGPIAAANTVATGVLAGTALSGLAGPFAEAFSNRGPGLKPPAFGRGDVPFAATRRALGATVNDIVKTGTNVAEMQRLQSSLFPELREITPLAALYDRSLSSRVKEILSRNPSQRHAFVEQMRPIRELQQELGVQKGAIVVQRNPTTGALTSPEIQSPKVKEIMDRALNGNPAEGVAPIEGFRKIVDRAHELGRAGGVPSRLSVPFSGTVSDATKAGIPADAMPKAMSTRLARVNNIMPEAQIASTAAMQQPVEFMRTVPFTGSLRDFAESALPVGPYIPAPLHGSVLNHRSGRLPLSGPSGSFALDIKVPVPFKGTVGDLIDQNIPRAELPSAIFGEARRAQNILPAAQAKAAKELRTPVTFEYNRDLPPTMNFVDLVGRVGREEAETLLGGNASKGVGTRVRGIHNEMMDAIRETEGSIGQQFADVQQKWSQTANVLESMEQNLPVSVSKAGLRRGPQIEVALPTPQPISVQVGRALTGADPTTGFLSGADRTAAEIAGLRNVFQPVRRATTREMGRIMRARGQSATDLLSYFGRAVPPRTLRNPPGPVPRGTGVIGGILGARANEP